MSINENWDKTVSEIPGEPTTLSTMTPHMVWDEGAFAPETVLHYVLYCNDLPSKIINPEDRKFIFEGLPGAYDCYMVAMTPEGPSAPSNTVTFYID